MSNHSTSCDELFKIYGRQEKIPYHLLLSTNEWKEKRKEILKRDSYACKVCKKRTTQHFEIEELQAKIGKKEINLTWKIAGKNRTVTEILDRGNYWFFSELSFKKFDAYGGCKYIKTPSGFILVKADNEYTLHVHHKIYILNILPWENYNKDFVTVCKWCHLETHKNDEIKAYRLINNNLVSAKLTPCVRCFGTGKIAKFEHVENGICFRCEGVRFEELIVNRDKYYV